MPSYNRFIELIPRSLPILFRFLQYSMFRSRKNSNVEYIDSTKVPVCHNKRNTTHKVFADKGYISNKLAQQLHDMGITLITTPKKNMKARFMPVNFIDVILHKKRSIIESIFNILKNKLNLSHARHRSLFNFIGHILSTLLGYQFLCRKPKIKLDENLNNFA